MDWGLGDQVTAEWTVSTDSRRVEFSSDSADEIWTYVRT